MEIPENLYERLLQHQFGYVCAIRDIAQIDAGVAAIILHCSCEEAASLGRADPARMAAFFKSAHPMLALKGQVMGGSLRGHSPIKMLLRSLSITDTGSAIENFHLSSLHTEALSASVVSSKMNAVAHRNDSKE